jgi:hypothetical protein
MDDSKQRGELHDALVEAALLPSTGPLLARAAFRLRSALFGDDVQELADAVHGMRDAIAHARTVSHCVPGELVRSLAQIEEWLRGRSSR